MTPITRRLSATLALAVALIPASLFAQDAAEARIQATLERAAEAGIPTSLLETRIAEGEAKGIAMERIADAVDRRLDGLDRARQALADVSDAGSDDLSVAADALESGVSEAVLTEIAETTPTERRTVAIAALDYLVASDVAPREALVRVREALERGPDALPITPPAGPPGPASVDVPAGEVGPPAGIPAPGDVPAAGPPDGLEPPVDGPGGPGSIPGGSPGA